MRDRLIELLNSASSTRYYDGDKIAEPEIDIDDNDIIRIADYLLENGVIVPPCKVGDKVFFVDIIYDEEGEEKLGMSIGEVVSFSMQKKGLWMYCHYEDGLTYWHKIDEELGITLFLTREEAEQALKGGEG